MDVPKGNTEEDTGLLADTVVILALPKLLEDSELSAIVTSKDPRASLICSRTPFPASP